MRSRTRKGLFWGTLILLAALAGGAWFAYTYATDGAALAALIKREAPRFLPGGRLEIAKAPWKLLFGELNLSHVVLWQTIDGRDHLALRIPWLSIRYDARALVRGRFVPRKVVVVDPVFRLCRRKDGTWNVQKLLADPWPIPATDPSPPIQIQNGQIDLCEDDGSSFAVLREVMLQIEPTTPTGPLRFEGTAGSDAFDHLQLSGTIDRANGRLTLSGVNRLSGLKLSEALVRRLPADIQLATRQAGLTAEEVDLSVQELTYDPAAIRRLRYSASARLRGGAWKCPKLPFPLSDVSADASARDGVLTIERAEGHNGKTTVRVRRGATIDLDDPKDGPMHLTIDVVDLEFDPRLRDWAWAPPEFQALWDDYLPEGRINLALTALRERPGGPVGFGMGVDCLDVGMTFRHFPYPLKNLRGKLKWSGDRITIDVQTANIGGKPAGRRGTIEHPGPNAVVTLDFRAEALPIDATLLAAMPPDIRTVVKDFDPTGSVRGTAHMVRQPRTRPDDPPEGTVRIDAKIDLNEGCSITWKDMPYPISDLTGRLELHPTSWEFQDMRGRNQQATILGHGRVDKVGDQLKTDVWITSQDLPFDKNLRAALRQPAWLATWDTLRPSGSSGVAAHVWNEPGSEPHTHLVIVPRAETRIMLKLPRAPRKGGTPGETFNMPPMEKIDGQFVYDDGTVSMSKVRFQFRDSPVQFARGTVTIQDNGRFDLKVWDLEVDKFRVDAGLREIMPELMAQFARRLDDGRTFRFHSNLGIGWSGRPGDLAWCSWDHALIVFNGNTIKTGLDLEHLQGQIDHLHGLFDARGLELHGDVNLDSISFLGQQVTGLKAKLNVGRDRAELGAIQGVLLGGEVGGRVAVDLETTPRYEAEVALRGADLQQYTKTISGRQSFRGQVDARLALNGLGQELRTLQGRGWARISNGDLGKLPPYLLLVKFLNLSPLTKTAFDSAATEFTIQNGEVHFRPITFTGNAFSLHGQGTLDTQGELDLKLKILYGRDAWHIPLVSDAIREASGKIFLIRVQGTPAVPRFDWVPLQPVSNAVGKTVGAVRRGLARDRQR